MTDPFLNLSRPGGWGKTAPPVKSKSPGGAHHERAHSKFSASGAERWFECPGSVQLSEGLPDKPSKWSEEGTLAHEVLELLLLIGIKHRYHLPEVSTVKLPSGCAAEMYEHCKNTANFILSLHFDTLYSECLVETRIYLDFIHPEMFGTFDGAVVDHFGTLHVFDFKYGAGVFVTPKENLQMIFYGMGLAARYDWNFKNVRLWIIQPRVKGYDGPLFWDLTMKELRAWEAKFRTGVWRVEKFPQSYVEGQHCHWCKAKKICPVKQEKKLEDARSVFTLVGLDE